jgi:predicted nucleic acid-binding protein
LIELKDRLKLDFDDAYQYQVASKYEINLVTFDQDFRKSRIKALAPLEAVQLFKKQ